MYNKTDIQTGFDRMVYHRDRFAHYLRWSHVLKNVNTIYKKNKLNVLDFGCGTGELLMVLYRNRYTPKRYLGLDIRNSFKANNEKYFSNWSFNPEFKQIDLCGDVNFGNDWDIITCFEVAEHIGKHNIDKLLTNIQNHCNDKTKVFLSTPNYDPVVGAAANHIIDDKVGEFDHFELQKHLEKYFTIEKKYGTFASIKDYKKLLNEWQKKMFDTLHEYYDTNLLSVLMAPMFPEQSRNCLWVLKKK